jgi:hypothetical protein
MEPPPMRPASEREWCGERKGRVVTRAALAGRSPLMEWICFVSRSPTIVVRPPPTARKSQFVAIPDKKVPGALWEWTCDLDELDFLDEDSVCDFRPG